MINLLFEAVENCLFLNLIFAETAKYNFEDNLMLHFFKLYQLNLYLSCFGIFRAHLIGKRPNIVSISLLN
jgi:hypothetical protein